MGRVLSQHAVWFLPFQLTEYEYFAEVSAKKKEERHKDPKHLVYKDTFYMLHK